MEVTCSPKADPATMRVRRPEMGKRRTLEVEEETHPGADRAHAAPSGRRAGHRSLGSPDRKEARHQRGDLPSLEEPIRRDEGRCDQTPEGAGKGERPPEEDRRRAGSGHQHPKGGEPKKLLSPTRRRAAVEHVRRHLGVSERRACEAIGQPRSTQRYVGRPKAEWDRRLVERMVVLSREKPRYGHRRVWALLRREGWLVNKKRVHRLWREEGLKVPGGESSENGCASRKAGARTDA